MFANVDSSRDAQMNVEYFHRAGHYQHAYSCLLEANSYAGPGSSKGDLCLEQARLMWAKGEHMTSINILEDFIQKFSETQVNCARTILRSASLRIG